MKFVVHFTPSSLIAQVCLDAGRKERYLMHRMLQRSSIYPTTNRLNGTFAAGKPKALETSRSYGEAPSSFPIDSTEDQQTEPGHLTLSKCTVAEPSEYGGLIRKRPSPHQFRSWRRPISRDAQLSVPEKDRTRLQTPFRYVGNPEKYRTKSHAGFTGLENPWESATWYQMLETIRRRRRQNDAAGAWKIYEVIIRSELDLPTEDKQAAELWEHFIQLCCNDFGRLSLVAEYAVGLRHRTGRAVTGLYSAVVGYQLGRNPSDALSLHRYLKTLFPPNRKDFESLLRHSLLADQMSFDTVAKIYKDCPVPELYSVMVPELCRRSMRTEATEWHFLLVERGDLPKSFHECKPLFEHYSHVKDTKVVEALAMSLVKKQLWFEKEANNFVRNDRFLSQEIMNRALGEAHGIAPKSLSDDFCARLFATKFFSVAMVINGLEVLGLESLGPSSVRELVVRDDHHCEEIIRHIDMLKGAGIALVPCNYNRVIEKAASDGQVELLKSITSTDLHFDQFENMDVQERLLARYCEKGDHMQMERTLATLQSATPEPFRDIHHANLLLRCYVSLRNRPKVTSILESMRRNRYPLAPRSSRHLRTTYLEPRSSREKPSESEQALKDITLMINVMTMTLKAGGSIPIKAWKEILKRLGMMGHLAQYQSLALWLVNWYSRPLRDAPQYGTEHLVSSGMRIVQKTSSTSLLPLGTTNAMKISEDGSPLSHKRYAELQNRDLLILFGKDAQQAMIAWGFQAEVKRRPILPSPRKSRYGSSHTPWQWGLRLLKELQRRGVQINKTAVARACMHRLAQLFNDDSVSKEQLNRRAKALNDERSKTVARFRYGGYIQEIEEIWGQDLFKFLAADGVGPALSVIREPHGSKLGVIKFKKA